MKHPILGRSRHSLAAAAAFFLLFSSGWADPVGTSITISDANYAGSGWYSNREDNETETNPNTITAQVWDLEGMYLNGSNLSLVGGFDFQDGVVNAGKTYKTGDIFIDVNGDAKYGQAANGGSGTSAWGSTATVANSFGYDYVISFNAAVTQYSVFQITPLSLVRRVTDVPSSNPWRYVSGGTAVADYQNVAIGGFGTLLPSEYNALETFGSTSPGLLGDASGNNTHYYLTVDLSFLPDSTLTTLHYTLECGNDNLMGRFTTPPRVPDSGATALLLVVPIAAMVGIRRRRR